MYLVVGHAQLARAKGYPELSEKQVEWVGRNTTIGSHTVTHPLLTRISLEEAYNEIVDSKAMLEAEFNTKVDKFCYPRGYANPEIQKIVVEAGYESARSTLVGYIHESENPYFEQTTLHVGCDRKEYGGMSWYDYGIEMYELAKKEPDANYHIWGHGWEVYKNDGVNDLKRLLKVLCEST